MIKTFTTGELTIGDNVLINSGASIQASSSVKIESHVRIAPLVSIADTNFHEVRPGEGIRSESVVVEEDVWVGHGACVMPGVRIGRGAVVGAGSVVTRDVEPYTVVAGVPAKRVRKWPATNQLRR
jgi:acetyltransferase-like isoleucine patch superfamily enzyme